MSSNPDFFLLSTNNTLDTDQSQTVCLSGKVFILPKNNLEYYIRNGLFEKNLIDWSSQFLSKSKIFLDIGAHTGTYTVSLAEYCSHVIAFEPQKQPFYALCGSVALSKCLNVTCLQLGLGSASQVGINTLYVPSIDGGGASIIPESLGSTPVLRTEPIEIRTLDSFAFTNIGFIKMDVEENELEVLKGAVNTLLLSNYPPILFENNSSLAHNFSQMNRKNDELINFCSTSSRNTAFSSESKAFLEKINFLQDLGYGVTQTPYNTNMFIACR